MTRPKTGGRVQGTPNKATAEMRELISNFIENNVKNLQSDFDQLESKEKLIFFEKLLPYVLPKATEMIERPDESNLPITVIVGV